MKKSVKVIIALLVLALVIGGCVFAFTRENYGDNKKADIVLITDGSNVEENRISEIWQGTKEYAKDNEMKSNYLIPKIDENSSLDTKKIAEYIDMAVNNGAKYIVLPDEQFAVAAYEIGSTYKDVKFLLVDAFPHSQGDTTMRTLSNVMPIKFDNLDAGFLAGYSLVKDGYTKVGFIGSSKDNATGDFSGGFKQGATYAAIEDDVEITYDHAEYDSIGVTYDYTLNAKAVYEPISEDAHKLTVVDGYGSGYYKEGQTVTLKANDNPKDKMFDHWDIKSDTEGVDSSSIVVSDVNSSDSSTVTIGAGDITITAVYKDVKTQEILIKDANGSVYKTLNVPENTTVKITAPTPDRYMDLVSWDCNFSDAIDDEQSKVINVTVKDKPLILTPKYEVVSTAAFNVIAENGEGTGSYKLGDKVNLVAEDKEGYMFTKWKITDYDGYSNFDNIDLSNPNLTFDAPNMYDFLPKKMFDNGTQVLFTNDEFILSGTLNAANETDGLVYCVNPDDKANDKLVGYVDYDYKKAIKLALNGFKGGSIFSVGTNNECISISNKSFEVRSTDEKGNEVVNDNYDQNYAILYKSLGKREIALSYVQTGADMRDVSPSSNVIFNYWLNV